MTLEQIIESSFDFSDYKAEEKTEMINETAGLLMEAALIQSLDKGGEKVQKDFDTFMETNPDDAAMNAYIQESIPNFEEFLIAEINEMKKMGGAAE